MSLKTAILTTIFPNAEDYFDDFLGSLNVQTNSNFVVIVINDGVKDFTPYESKYSKLNFLVIRYSSSPPKNREFGIKWAKNNGIQNLIFADIDDYFSKNRVEVCLELLTKWDVVVNDLTLFSDIGTIAPNYLSNRIADKTELNIDFVLDKNVFGLSNSAIKTSVIPDFTFQPNLIAVDWYFFSVLLLNEAKAVFTNQCVSYYRQYSSNTIGAGEITKKSILTAIKVKIIHYEALMSESDRYKNYLEKTLLLSDKVHDGRFLTSLTNQDLFNPLWWEEAKE